MSLKDFAVIGKLGQGSYSQVYKVKRIEDGQYYALKKVNLTNLNDKEKQNALNEIRILASIRHPNIISYKEAFIDVNSNHLCIIMELAESGDLMQRILMHQKNSTSFSEFEIFRCCYSLLHALNALHSMKILHRDIKCANVFLQANGEVKLGDMNVSKVAKKGLLHTQTGTPYYASPEVWKDLPYDQKSDIWSLGCVVYEMATLVPPFKAEDMDALFKKVCKGYYNKIPSTYSNDLAVLVRMMLQVSTSLRPTAQGMLECGFFSKLRTNPNSLPIEINPSQQKLLATIIFPKNFNTLQNLLPKSNYQPVAKFKTEAPESELNRKKCNVLQAQSPAVRSDNEEYIRLNRNLSDRHNVSKIISEYKREILLAHNQHRKNRRLSQMDIQKKAFVHLPMIDQSPAKVRHSRNCSLPLVS